MLSQTRSLLVSVAVALAGLALLDAAFGAYAKRHFGPDVALHDAEKLGDGCLLTLGDSRMAAGIDPAALAEGLREGGAPRCVAPLAIGASPISGSAMALRRYLADGRKPAIVVLGESPGSLLPYTAPVDPADLFGNRAAEVAWSEASDVRRFYPDFPFAELDRGIRFTLARTNALMTYESAAWIKAKGLQDKLAAGGPAAPRNRFGAVSDMNALLGDFRSAALRGLAAYDGRWEDNAWFVVLRDLVRRSGARLVVLEVPMRSAYRTEVLDRPVTSRYREWLRGELAREGTPVVDMSATPVVSDADFGDGLHLDAEGAKRFSRELGAALARGAGE
jgi:hypothetical protein